MFREFVVVCEHFVANCTNVWLEVGVANAHVLDQFRWVVELGLADLADQGVRSHVSCKVVLLVESLFADGTSKRPFICMRSNVRLEVVGLAKLLAAVRTGKWFGSRMNLHMRRKIIRLNKTLPTDGTIVRFLNLSMFPQMYR